MLKDTFAPKLFPGTGPGVDATSLSAVRVNGADREETVDTVVNERPLTIFLKDTELVTLLCSPSDMEYLAVGFLFAEGFLHSKDDIKTTTIDTERGIVRITRKNEFPQDEVLFKRLITSACGRGAAYYSTRDAQDLSPIESELVISERVVFSLLEKFNKRCNLFGTTGGVHSAALADSNDIVVFKDDLGRHNAIDKVFGECLLKGIPTADRILITSGRSPSEMVLKAAKARVPILISVGATTDLSVKVAKDIGMTLVGFARGKGMIIYNNEWRISRELCPR
jgi:FdhD protein